MAEADIMPTSLAFQSPCEPRRSMVSAEVLTLNIDWFVINSQTMLIRMDSNTNFMLVCRSFRVCIAERIKRSKSVCTPKVFKAVKTKDVFVAQSMDAVQIPKKRRTHKVYLASKRIVPWVKRYVATKNATLPHHSAPMPPQSGFCASTRDNKTANENTLL